MNVIYEEKFDNDSAKNVLFSQADENSFKEFNHRDTPDRNGIWINDSENFTSVSKILITSCSKQEDLDKIRDQTIEKYSKNGISKTTSKKRGSRMYSVIYADVMEALNRPESSYSLLYELPSCLNSNILQKDMKESSPKKKSKCGLNSFMSLTGTGLLDGVPVNYVCITGKVPGIIKGNGYLCGCQSCKYIKTVDAFEFEHHAKCETSNPNEHIRFENGKSIFRVFQEMKTYPESISLEAIQTLIGFPIREESIFVWKESLRKMDVDIQVDYHTTLNDRTLSCNRNFTSTG